MSAPAVLSRRYGAGSSSRTGWHPTGAIG